MTKTFSFKLEMRNTGNTAYPVYVAEETVDAPYTVHLQLDGNAKQRPVPLVVEQKSEDTDFVKIDNLSISVLKARGFVYDKSFSTDTWPKQVRITSPLPVVKGNISFGSSGGGGTVPENIEQRLSELEKKVSAQSQIISEEDADNNGIPDGEDRLRKIEESTQVVVDENGFVL